MNHVGIDLHKLESQICVLPQQGGEPIEGRILTRRDRFEAVLEQHRPAKVLLEATNESEWVARHLEGCGFEVVVADPNYAPMYAHRTRRIKTDRRDARTLAEACRRGTYRAAHRLSEAQWGVRVELTAREALVRTRARYVGLIRALLRHDGFRVGSGATAHFGRRVGELELPELTRARLVPLLEMLEQLNVQIKGTDRELGRQAQESALIQRLCTVPGVGPLTALAYVSTLDNVERFPHAHRVESYLGIVPREKSSGEKQQRGRITKTGSTRMRWMLVETAWRVMISRDPEGAGLRHWATQIARRRGRRIAVTALARRLAGILFAIWRDDAVFDPERFRVLESSPGV